MSGFSGFSLSGSFTKPSCVHFLLVQTGTRALSCTPRDVTLRKNRAAALFSPDLFKELVRLVKDTGSTPQSHVWACDLFQRTNEVGQDSFGFYSRYDSKTSTFQEIISWLRLHSGCSSQLWP